MNLLQAEFKSVKIQTPEEEKEYIVKDGHRFMIASYEAGFWYVDGLKLVGSSDFYHLDFKPTHFAEIKTGETK